MTIEGVKTDIVEVDEIVQHLPEIQLIILMLGVFAHPPQKVYKTKYTKLIHTKKRHPKVSSSDLNHFNFNNMYWTPIRILFYHVKLFYSLRNLVHIYILLKFTCYVLRYIRHGNLQKLNNVITSSSAIVISLIYL
ncbi:hypothetical protein IKC_05822 [Bacillus cereus VD184]|uniref:Uncharacterized protein n=1 Tax=Bacillus cereus VD184 TaxID=1053242 RepID=A0A9W5R1G8_BACCE|nr:hypothetical protein IKC_05822 [Bacillus cereus VD184]